MAKRSKKLYQQIKRDCAVSRKTGDRNRAQLLGLVLSEAVTPDDEGVLASIRSQVQAANRLLQDVDIKPEIKGYCREDLLIMARYTEGSK